MHNQEKRSWELTKWLPKELNAQIIFQILPTNSVRKCIEISLENLYAAIGAKRVKEALLDVVRMSLLQWNLDLTNLYIMKSSV